jgi:hypothetical protein
MTLRRPQWGRSALTQIRIRDVEQPDDNRREAAVVKRSQALLAINLIYLPGHCSENATAASLTIL